MLACWHVEVRLEVRQKIELVQDPLPPTRAAAATHPTIADEQITP
jgi:hypothetical protein